MACMKVYISADLEGVLGVTSPHQCFPTADPAGYHQAVNQLVLELNTVISAFQQHNVMDITVNDAHGYMANLAPLHLPNHVRLLTGKPKAYAMSAGLDSTYTMACYIGYHSKVGTENGVLCHTFHDQIWDVSVNGVSLGEGGFNALYAGIEHQVPVALVSGDAAFCAELQALLPNVTMVVTKQGLSFSAALHESWDTLNQRYVNAVGSVCKTSPPKPLHWPAPYELTVTLATTQGADIACTLPWLTRINGRQFGYTAPSFATVYKALQSVYAILAYPATPAASHLD
jgi:D-amino peptidase